MALLTNLATNPQPKNNDTNWSRDSVTATTTWTRFTTGFDGSADAYMRMEWSTVTGDSDGHVQYAQPVTPGLSFSAALEIISSRTQVFVPTIVFIDAGAGILQTSYGVDVAAPAGVVTRLGIAGLTVPVGAVTAQIVGATSLDNGTPWQVGDTLDVSRVIPTTSLSTPAYFDGSYPDAAWTGTAYESTSEFVESTVPTVTPLPDWAPIPRMDVLFPAFHPLAQTATVYRTSGGRTRRVRSQINVFAVGGLGFLDFEAPPAVLSTYRAEQFDSEGVTLGFTESGSATLTGITVGEASIHQPLDPTKSVRVTFDSKAVTALVKPTRGQLLRPEGRPEPVWVGGPRRALENIPLFVWTETLAAAAALDSIFGTVDDPQIPIMCLRTVNMDLPPTMFVVVEDPTQRGYDRFVGGETIEWDISGNEVSPPAEGLIVPFLTYDDLDAAYATYDDRDAAYATYLEQDTDWSLAGVAG